MAVNNLDQNDRSKRKFLDLKTDAGEVLGLEQSSYAVNISLPVFEMGAKTSTAVVPYGLRSKRSSKKGNY